MIKLDEALDGVQRIALDTMSIIYYVETNPRYVAKMDKVFDRMRDERLIGVASTVTLLEVLVQPLRLGNALLAENYRRFLSASGNFEMHPVTEAIAETAADLRARWSLRTADAIVAATAIQSDCQALVTNDERLLRVTELQVIYLDNTAL